MSEIETNTEMIIPDDFLAGVSYALRADLYPITQRLDALGEIWGKELMYMFACGGKATRNGADGYEVEIKSHATANWTASCVLALCDRDADVKRYLAALILRRKIEGASEGKP